MDIPIKRLTTREPIFMSGTNCSNKLDINEGRLRGMAIIFRPAQRIYIVTFKGCAIIVHDSGAVYSEPMNIQDLKLDAKAEADVVAVKPPKAVKPVKHHPQTKNAPIIAQVGDPTRGNMG